MHFHFQNKKDVGKFTSEKRFALVNGNPYFYKLSHIGSMYGVYIYIHLHLSAIFYH